MSDLSQENRAASEIADEADRRSGHGPDAWREALSEIQTLEAFVRDPKESYLIFQDTCFDRRLTGEQLILELLDRLTLRVARLEQACSGQLRDHRVKAIIRDRERRERYACRECGQDLRQCSCELPL
jgi:hypothetical protein